MGCQAREPQFPTSQPGLRAAAGRQKPRMFPVAWQNLSVRSWASLSLSLNESESLSSSWTSQRPPYHPDHPQGDFGGQPALWLSRLTCPFW